MLHSLNLNYKQWLPYVKEKVNKNHIINSDICPYIDLALSTRIGSESNYAEIYLYQPPLCNCNYAIKVIPTTESMSKFVEREIKFTIQCSNSLLPFYPKCYEHGYCDITLFHKDSKFKTKNTTKGYYMVMELLDFDLFTSRFMEWLSNSSAVLSKF